MTTLFISDLHLDENHQDIGVQFLEFLENEAAGAEALYILGDLFESWVGDDDPNEHYAEIKRALRYCTDRDLPVYFMHGNRDFMIGGQFAKETGVVILSDPCLLEIHGTTLLLSHGDAMCTDDVEYQQVRAMTRNPDWQAMMLEKTLQERLQFAEHARQQSLQHKQVLSNEISDVNQNAVEATLREHKVSILLHGHTHRPKVHEFLLDGAPATRIVLGDWYDHGSVVRWNADGYSLDTLARR